MRSRPRHLRSTGGPTGIRRRRRVLVAALHDQYLGSLARQIRALGRPVLLRYAGDMDRAAGWRSSGYGPAFVAAWRHVHELFAAEGVAGSWVWSPHVDAFAGARGGVDR